MKNYKIIIGSPVDYEYLTADVVINGEYVLRVQQELGQNNLMVEFFEDLASLKVSLHDLNEALIEAQHLLLK